LSAPDYLLIGHITHDDTPQGPRIGGTVSYAGGAAGKLGMSVAAVSSIRRDDPVLAALPPMALARVETETSSIFVNSYEGEKRKQILRSRAAPLALEDVPSHWRNAPIVHLAPLTDEVDPALGQAFPGSLVAATPQGWMRAWDGEGVIHPKPWQHAETLLPILGATVLSEEDIHHDRDLEAHYAAIARLLVVTRAAAGCTIYQQGKAPVNVPAPAVTVLDATGAGDVFTGVFLTLLHRTGDVHKAAACACQLASYSVTRIGLEGLPTQAEIDAALASA
jgi:sugar/nucleoside kinase (ribokinase family)